MTGLSGAPHQALADPNRAVERGHRHYLPQQRDQTERHQMQRVEDHSRKRRIGERQREVRGLISVDVAIQGAGMVEGRCTAHVNVQVDEVCAVGRQIGPGESRTDAEDQ
ncbi:Uncharacterised protein [Mycobacterium tuberculosis]|uniref:Uncharacterized protein n=1 Tax=Mycobacterium tuberculosis TaxID=1773 RepID=A0A0T9EQF6_MYCTX|nr:Uncharacterised protein [Mycobacterium tuberculosis]CKT29109.1 Uncharacterised protein [Mycobacterium tuberculosis]CKT32386.1 Uncharacterised protein [Mycobacterium tuberculosis]COW31492.1 Uncharacterised protein [Mycobacterium tuberculosis]COX70049.1 Uncharacterised protein [Mycobacterium tuberculosis]